MTASARAARPTVSANPPPLLRLLFLRHDAPPFDLLFPPRGIALKVYFIVEEGQRRGSQLVSELRHEQLLYGVYDPAPALVSHHFFPFTGLLS